MTYESIFYEFYITMSWFGLTAIAGRDERALDAWQLRDMFLCDEQQLVINENRERERERQRDRERERETERQREREGVTILT